MLFKRRLGEEKIRGKTKRFTPYPYCRVDTTYFTFFQSLKS